MLRSRNSRPIATTNQRIVNTSTAGPVNAQVSGGIRTNTRQPATSTLRQPATRQPIISQPATSTLRQPATRQPAPKVPTVSRPPKILNLYPCQVPHCDRINEILELNKGYLDTSEVGTGKTMQVIARAIAYDTPILVVCPLTIKKIWIEEPADYGVEVIDVLNYNTIRGTRTSTLKHGYLTRHDGFDSVTGKATVSFEPTELLLNLIDHGFLLVIDECQMVKNGETAQYDAVGAICKAILGSENKSRFALLSATPLDRVEHVISLLRLLGYISPGKLYSNKDGFNVLQPLEDLITQCEIFDKETTDAIVREGYPTRKEDVNPFCAKLMREVVRPAIFSSMPPLVIPGINKDCANGFYIMEEADRKDLESAVKNLSRASGFEKGGVKLGKEALGKINKALVKIENSKVNLFVSKTRDYLAVIPNCRVIICIHFTETTLKALLSEFTKPIGHPAACGIDFPEFGINKPLVLTGKSSEKERNEIVRLFQEGESRVLLTQIRVGGLGLNLHDTRGDEPRVTLMSPGYSLTELHQAAGRTYRQGAKSDVIVRNIYGEGIGCSEEKILAALARKREVVESTLSDEARAHILFPDQYAHETELVVGEEYDEELLE